MNKNRSRNALGRGLSNLIPSKLDINDEHSEIHEVSIDSIRTNPFQPRIDFDEEEIKGLSESIKNQGLLQPIVVRQKEDYFEIISGERRFRAFQLLHRDTISCIIKKEVSDREMLELALIENIQREELNEIEKAAAYQKLLLEYNYTHEQLSERVGKSRTAVTNALRLLNLPDEIQHMVRRNQISMGHARALLSIKKESQMEIAEKIVNDQLSVRDIENISVSKKSKKPKTTKNNPDPDIMEVVQRLHYKFGTPVKIHRSSKTKGSISISYFNDEDLTRIVDLLLQ